MRDTRAARRSQLAAWALLAGLLAAPAHAIDRGQLLDYEARLSSEQLSPEVDGESRELSQQGFEVSIRESVGPWFHGDLRLGFLSTRWRAPDEANTPRLSGQLLGIGGGGRHPRDSSLALRWKARYTWQNLSGRLGGDDLNITQYESLATLGLDLDLGAVALAAGSEWRRYDGEERVEDNGRTDRSLDWRAGRWEYLELRMALPDDGGLGARYASGADGRSVSLFFTRHFW